jgi:hypothetical protein
METNEESTQKAMKDICTDRAILEIFAEAQHLGCRHSNRYYSEYDYLSLGERFYLLGMDSMIVPSSEGTGIKRKTKRKR